MMNRIGRFALALGFVLLIAGCGSKINQSNFDKITNDMTREQVEAILGKPTEASSTDIGIVSGGSSTWKDKNGAITVQFVNDKVMSKSFQSGAATATGPAE